MIRLFSGYDAREAIGFHVFVASLLRHASVPVSVTALASQGMPVGTNEFTYSRFLVPHLCGYQGRAIFVDGADMLMCEDVAELDALADPAFAVQVVQRPNYATRHPRKYVGTGMESANRNYARKNWASVMLFNCAHPYWRAIRPETLLRVAGLSLLQFGGLKPREIGALPDRWNRLVDEGDAVEGAAIMHWTAGSPAFPAYSRTPGAELWREHLDQMVAVA